MANLNPALLARHLGNLIRGNAFHFGTVSGLLVSRITGHHAVLVEEMEITLPRFTMVWCRHFMSLIGLPKP